MIMYIISVIIPIFNSENTIERSIESFLNQKWRGNSTEELELILIDDCSTDNTKKIIDNYAKKYSNISSYSTEYNMGSPSKARNIGIDKSNSQYLMFMDSDDEYCEDMCQKLYDTLIQEDVSLVSCNYYDIFTSHTNKVFYCHEIPEYTIEKDYMILDSANSMLSRNIVVWNKIFDKSIIKENNIYFPYKVSEDIFFCWEYFSHIDKMIFLKDYYGIKRNIFSDSFSYGPNLEVVLGVIKSARELDKKLVNEYIDFNKYPDFRYSFSIGSIEFIIKRISFFNDSESIKICLNELYNYEKEINFNMPLENKLFNFINFFVLKKHFTIATMIFNTLNFIRNSNILYKFSKKILNLIKKIK